MPQEDPVQKSSEMPPEATPTGLKKSRPSKFLPTNRVAFKKQWDLLRAYGLLHHHNGQLVSTREAGEMAGLMESTATLLNAFFVENEFLRRSDNGFLPAQDVVAFAKAHEWDPATAGQKLAPLFEGTWFGKALLPRLRFGQRDEQDALSVLAEASSATSEYRKQLAIFLDYLSGAGLIEREGKIVKMARGTAPRTDPPAPQEDGKRQEPPPQREEGRPVEQQQRPANEPRESGYAPQTGAGVIQFQVSVDVRMEDFSGWSADRISAFFSGIAQVLAAKSGLDRGNK